MNRIAHTITVTTTDAGRDYDWTHPTTCPDGDTCEIYRRVCGNREFMSELAEDRPDGEYLLGLYGFTGLCLIDEAGHMLPDVADAA
ncbi:hypothetical protein [Streptomyces erythrochromogenes]|uniref:hypothetical protein n=1 Tax=Streptomyces erythrochromogenes TaxID=285574 RepID=UPI0037D12C07